MSDQNFLIIYFFLIFGGKFAGAKEPYCEHNYDDSSYNCGDVVDSFPDVRDEIFEELKCEKCIIPTLSKDTFAPNTNCTSLYLSNNVIQRLLPRAFSNLPRIQYIHLDNNKISNISTGAFDGMRQIEQIHLERNKISEIVPGSFRGLDSTYVHLSGNKISVLPNYAFEGVQTIMSIDLQSNEIETLHYDSFVGIDNLENLQLQNNRLCHLPIGVFRSLKNLKELNISANNFAKLHPSYFSGLRSLNTLALANNSLVTFDASILLSFSKLVELDISGNGIYWINSKDIFISAPTLKFLYIDDNLFSCSLLANVLQFFKEKAVEVEYFPGRFNVQNINGIACIEEEVTETISFKYFLQKAKLEGELEESHC